MHFINNTQWLGSLAFDVVCFIAGTDNDSEVSLSLSLFLSLVLTPPFLLVA